MSTFPGKSLANTTNPFTYLLTCAVATRAVLLSLLQGESGKRLKGGWVDQLGDDNVEDVDIQGDAWNNQNQGCDVGAGGVVPNTLLSRFGSHVELVSCTLHFHTSFNFAREKT